MAVNKLNLYSDSYVISLPFKFNNGRLEVVKDDSARAWNDKVRTIVMTDELSRVWYKYYGASINNFLFDPHAEALTAIPAAIEEAFVRWLPDLRYLETTVEYDSTTGEATFGIIYQLPEGEEVQLDITTAELTRAGETVRVISNG